MVFRTCKFQLPSYFSSSQLLSISAGSASIPPLVCQLYLFAAPWRVLSEGSGETLICFSLSILPGLESGSQLCTCALRWKWKWQKGNSVAREWSCERAWRPRSTQSSQVNLVKISTPQVRAGFAWKEEFKGNKINFIWGANQIGQNLWCKVIKSDWVKLVMTWIRFGLRLQQIEICWIFLKNTRH